MENFKILSEFDNALFKRKEILFQVNSRIAPSKEEVVEFLSKKFSCDPERIALKKILGEFGKQIFKISAKIYETKEDKEYFEIKTRKQREAEKKALEERIKAEREARKKAEEKSEEKKEKEEKTANEEQNNEQKDQK